MKEAKQKSPAGAQNASRCPARPRLGSQKAPWFVAADMLAAYINGLRDEATKLWRKLQEAS